MYLCIDIIIRIILNIKLLVIRMFNGFHDLVRGYWTQHKVTAYSN